jgi:hypothetical protein
LDGRRPEHKQFPSNDDVDDEGRRTVDREWYRGRYVENTPGDTSGFADDEETRRDGQQVVTNVLRNGVVDEEYRASGVLLMASCRASG